MFTVPEVHDHCTKMTLLIRKKYAELKYCSSFPCCKIIPSCLIIVMSAQQSGGSQQSLRWHNCFHEFSKGHWCKLLKEKREAGRPPSPVEKKAHKTNIWWWQPVKLRKVNVKNRCSAVSHCYFCMIIPRCWRILSSSLAVYHMRDSTMKMNLRKVIYIDAHFILIIKGLQKRQQYSSSIFFNHLIPRAFESWLVSKSTKLECYSWQPSTAKCLTVSESCSSQ